MSEINWPDCFSCVGILKTTSFFVFSSSAYKVFSLSGGQLQYSSHPGLTSFSTDSPPTEDDSMSRVWKLKTLTLLDDFAFDPRNPACSEHANMNGGLYKAEIEENNECEITVSAEMAREPVRIQFLSKATCDKFKAIIALNKPCCLEKFQQAVNEQVAQKTENK